MQEWLNFGGGLLTSIVTSTGVGGICVWLGKAWVTKLFDIEFQNIKYAHDNELDKLKSYRGTLVNRTTKLHQQEFEVIPEIWALLLVAEAKVRDSVSPLQQYPDINRMPAERMQAFIDDSGMAAWQKSEFIQEKDKNKYYQRYVDWKKLSGATEAYQLFHIAFRSKVIFLTADMKAKIEEFDDSMWSAITEHKFHLEMKASDYDDPSLGRNSRNAFLEGAQGKAGEVETLIRDRLWNKGIDGGGA